MINTCNELNAGYAADGYARERGIACCVVTYTGAPCPAVSRAQSAAGASCCTESQRAKVLYRVLICSGA